MVKLKVGQEIYKVDCKTKYKVRFIDNSDKVRPYAVLISEDFPQAEIVHMSEGHYEWFQEAWASSFSECIKKKHKEMKRKLEIFEDVYKEYIKK